MKNKQNWNLYLLLLTGLALGFVLVTALEVVGILGGQTP